MSTPTKSYYKIGEVLKNQKKKIFLSRTNLK